MFCCVQVMTDVVGNPEYERNADFYNQPWTNEAVNRYLYNKVSRPFSLKPLLTVDAYLNLPLPLALIETIHLCRFPS